jgi:hypothetical protein
LGAQSHGGSTDSPQELFRLKHNSVGSANVALRQIVAALRLVKTRRDMALRATPARLADFVSYSRLLLRMMNGSPSGLELFTLPGLDWASILDGPEEDTNGSQKMTMVVDGRNYCKLTWDVLNNRRLKRKAQFCADLSLVFVDLFRERCYEVWNMVEEACPSIGKRTQN